MVNKTFDNKPLEILMKGQGPFHIRLGITEADQVEKFKKQERRMNDDLVDAVDWVGAKVVFCRAKIVKPVADEMSRRGIIAFELVNRLDMDAVAEADRGDHGGGREEHRGRGFWVRSTGSGLRR